MTFPFPSLSDLVFHYTRWTAVEVLLQPVLLLKAKQFGQTPARLLTQYIFSSCRTVHRTLSLTALRLIYTAGVIKCETKETVMRLYNYFIVRVYSNSFQMAKSHLSMIFTSVY